MPISAITRGTAGALRNVGHFGRDLIQPTVRLGVTGLARSGKTVFITALVHNLLASGRMPFFEPVAHGRLIRAYLEPQPDDQVPRFDYERHMADLTGDPPRWPESTRRISQLRIALEYEPRTFWKRRLGYDRLNVDIVDYPGEWLLDLPLLGLEFRAWSEQSLAQSSAASRRGAAKRWHAALAGVDPAAPADELLAQKLSDAFKAYLGEARTDPHALSTLPPGRFLMPGDLEGSPALTFSPLDARGRESLPKNSLFAMMERRYDAYRRHVVRPFFQNHFARLDRQIVLLDVLAALNGGKPAVAELERAMTDILACFRTGANSLWSSLFSPRIDKVLFAATKADHLHHSSHDRLEGILGVLTETAMAQARYAGADVKALALAAIRATREGRAKRNGEALPCIIGYPLAGETIGRRHFDGTEAFAIFPGDLPADPASALKNLRLAADDVRFVRFRPPDPILLPSGSFAPFPNIRLDRALQALLGDRLA